MKVLVSIVLGIVLAPCMVQACGCDYPGYRPDPESCCRYLVCDNCIEKTMTCPNGLHWNNKTQACDWPCNAGCAGGEGGEVTPPVEPTTGIPTQSPPTVTPPPITGTPSTGSPGSCCECNEGQYTSGSECCKFRVCDHGKYVELRCPGGLHWNNKTKACDWPCNAGCAEGGGEGGEGGEVTPPIEQTTEVPTQPPPTEEPTTEVPTQPPPTEEPTTEVPTQPPPTEEPTTEVPTQPPPTEGPTTEIPTQPPPTEEPTTEIPTQPPPTTEPPSTCCPGSCCECNEGQYTSGSECCKFRVCDHGKYVEMKCPAGLHWNNKTKACDWPCNAGCAGGGGEGGEVTPPVEPTTEVPTQPPPTEVPTTEVPTQPPPTEEPTTEAPTQPPPTEEPTTEVPTQPPPTEEPTTEAPTQPPPTEEPTTEIPTQPPPTTEPPSTCCPGSCCECDEGQYTSGSECCKFRVCEHGKYVELKCPAGLHWNNKTKACDWPCNAGCANITGTNPPVITPPPIVTPSTVSPPPVVTPPGTGNPGCGECECGTFSPVDGEACKYKVCDNGCWTTMKCPAGLVWNQNATTCAWGNCQHCESSK